MKSCCGRRNPSVPKQPRSSQIDCGYSILLLSNWPGAGSYRANPRDLKWRTNIRVNRISPFSVVAQEPATNSQDYRMRVKVICAILVVALWANHHEATALP